MQPGDWIQLAGVLVPAGLVLAGAVWGLVRTGINEAKRTANAAHSRIEAVNHTIHGMQLELAGDVVRKAELRQALDNALKPLNRRLDFQGELLTGIADRLDVPTGRFRENEATERG